MYFFPYIHPVKQVLLAVFYKTQIKSWPKATELINDSGDVNSVLSDAKAQALSTELTTRCLASQRCLTSLNESRESVGSKMTFGYWFLLINRTKYSVKVPQT